MVLDFGYELESVGSDVVYMLEYVALGCESELESVVFGLEYMWGNGAGGGMDWMGAVDVRGVRAGVCWEDDDRPGRDGWLRRLGRHFLGIRIRGCGEMRFGLGIE